MIYRYNSNGKQIPTWPINLFATVIILFILVFNMVMARFVFNDLWWLFTLAGLDIMAFKLMPAMLASAKTRETKTREIEIDADRNLIFLRGENNLLKQKISDIERTEHSLGFLYHIRFKFHFFSFSPFFINVTDALENFQKFQEELAAAIDKNRSGKFERKD